MERILLYILAAGAVLGGLDLLLGNRLRLGEQFENGFQLLGPTALSMAGILCLAPLLSRALELTLAPLFSRIGLDPAMLASLLAIDMGGYPMAAALAENAAVGRYAGILAAATLGCTVSFTIPLGTGMLRGGDADAFFEGILIGLASLPAALLGGALLSGLPLLTALVQTLPILLVSALLILGLRRFPKGMLRGFSWFANGIRAVSLLGLTLAAAQYISGLTLVPGLTPLPEAMQTVSAIGIVMLGSLPAAELLRRALSRPLRALGARLGMKDVSLAAPLIGFVSVTPAVALLRDMDRRGKVLNAAFLVCGASALAAHLGYTLSAAPEMIAPLLFTKLFGGTLAAALALLSTRRPRA